MPASVRAILVAGLFLLLLVGFRWPELYVMRELYALAEWAGVLQPNPVGAMQILGRYIPGPPLWLETAVRFTAALVGAGPAVVIAICVHRGNPARWGAPPLSWRSLWRLLLSTVVFALIVLPSERLVPDFVREWAFRAGAAAGCEYFMSGELMVGEDGPFFGGPAHGWFNAAWRWLPWISACLPPFFVALACDATLVRGLRRPGRCVRCDYRLDRNVSGVCPECGAPIAR